MESRLELLSCFNQRLKLGECHIAQGVGLQVLFTMAEDYSSDCLELLLIVGGKESKHLTFSPDSSGTTTSVNVDLSIEGALAMQDILDIGNIKTTGCNIGAY